MGGGTWNTGAYASATAARTAAGIDPFAYTASVRSGRASGVHASLDPTQMKNPDPSRYSFPLRESRDSDEHPESVPVAMIFDVTGSMGKIPEVLQTKLASLMDIIIDKAGLRDPQVLVGAVGDAYSDRYPFQVGQFESSNSFDEQLRNIILEGNGGGQSKESYALAYRFAADHTALDSFEKRGKKGYFFTMGDEAPWPTVTRSEVESLFGVSAAEDESIESLIARATEHWEVFHLFAQDGSYRDNPHIIGTWRKLLGERLVMVDDSSLVCETIAGIIHGLENAYDADRVVNDLGLSGAAAVAVKNALVPVVGTGAVTTHKGVRSGGAVTRRNTGGVSRI
jgi:hypothetical protein